MAPKKKTVKKKVGKKTGSSRGPTIIDGVPVAEMTKDQLEGHVRRLQEELSREREERNFFQVERDRIKTFWEVAKRQLDECRAEARVKDRELEENEDRHQTEIKVFKQKVKHLLYEQEHNLAEMKAENMVSLKVAREEHQRVEQEHVNDKRQLSQQLRAKDDQYQDLVRSLRLQQSETAEKLRAAFEDRVREVERRYADRFSALRAEMQLRLHSETSETEERKNAQIDNMRRKNEKAITDMKNYYNDITLNNLAMISTLKEELKQKSERMERNEQLLASVQEENKRLAEPLRQARDELVDLRRQLGTQEKEKSALVAARNKLKASQKQVDDLKWELEVLEQKYERAVDERDDIHEKFSTSILELQQKSTLKYLVLEKKITALRHELDVRDAQVQALADKEHDTDTDVSVVLDQTRDVVREKELRISRLERQVALMRLQRGLGQDSSDASLRRSRSSNSIVEDNAQ